MARIGAAVALACVWVLSPRIAHGLAPPPIEASVVVDLDDDDGNGAADARDDRVLELADCATYPVRELPSGLVFRGATPGDGVRVLVDGIPLAAGSAVPPQAQRISLQALRPGLLAVDLGSSLFQVRSVRLMALDGEGHEVSFASSHASLQRTIPDRLEVETSTPHDPDALRYAAIGRGEDLPRVVRIVSRSEGGELLQSLDAVRLVEMPCPREFADQKLTCKTTPPIRAAADEIDRSHPLVSDRSLRVELGGSLLVELAPGVGQQIRVGGPRKTAIGPIKRYRASLRVRLIRTSPGGAPPLGETDEAAISLARQQVALANMLWGQCGISFGAPDQTDIKLVDPPPASLVTVGCDLGTVSTGGMIRLQVDGQRIAVDVNEGRVPWQVALRLAREIEKHRLRVVLSPNPRIGPSPFGGVDLLVFRKEGTGAVVTAAGPGTASTDRGLGVCVGRADLAAGLRHFYDPDAVAGTFDERQLLKWIDDRDPTTINVVMISAFARGGRIGESFLGGNDASVRNTVVIDRAGVRAGRASFTLAHEIGHVLLEVPGHPDDYGVDTPTLLMDSDSVDPSAFGPRRLTIRECVRAVTQSGPAAPVPRLTVWPWGRLPKRQARH